MYNNFNFRKIFLTYSAYIVLFIIFQTSVFSSDSSDEKTKVEGRQMLTIQPLDPVFPIMEQLDVDVSPVVLINVFKVDSADVDQLIKAWEQDANWMKKQPGYISTQLHKGIGESCVFLNYAVWESVKHFKAAFTNPEFRSSLSAYPSSAVAQPHLFTKVAVPNLCTQ
jgi:heme-degrading monooxygenase HmoA